MGWARTLFLGDIGNRLDIADTERDIGALRRALRDHRRTDLTQDQQLEALAQENAELKLYLAALARLLMRKGVFDRGELTELIERIDAEDGAADGGYDGPLV